MDEFERRYNATYESERRRAVGEKRSRHHGSESKMQAQEEGNERQGFDQRDAGAAATGPEAASHDATHTAGTGVPIQMRTDYRRISPVGRAIVDALSPVAPSDVGEALGPRASGMAAHADPAASTGGAGLNEGPLFEEARAGEPQAGHSADPGERGSTDPAAPLGAQTGPEAEAQQSVLTEQEEEKVREVAMMMAVQEATEAMPVTDAILMGDVPDDEIYYYSRYHGFLELPRRLWPRHGVVVQNVTVPGNLSCFGPTPLKTLIELSLGFEAPVVSALGDLTGLKGFVHRKGSGESVALSATAPGHSVTDTAIERLAHRIGVLMASVILLIALSTIVSFLMQQLQVRAIRLMRACAAAPVAIPYSFSLTTPRVHQSPRAFTPGEGAPSPLSPSPTLPSPHCSLCPFSSAFSPSSSSSLPTRVSPLPPSSWSGWGRRFTCCGAWSTTPERTAPSPPPFRRPSTCGRRPPPDPLPPHPAA